MLTPFRVAIAGAVFLVAGLLAAAPRPLSTPIRKVANYRADSREPIYNYPLDGAAIRRAGKIVSASGRRTYYIRTRPIPQLGHGTGSCSFASLSRSAACARIDALRAAPSLSIP